jgi:hypothetical protein
MKVDGKKMNPIVKNKLISNKSAVAGVIEALLLVALVAVIISTVQLVYVPDIMEQREAEHMDEVENQFSYLKSVVDLQSMVEEDVPISSPLTLGSRELPYLVSARAFGQVSIIDFTENHIDLSFATDIPLTRIQYEAQNSYYLDQEFSLEGGAVILKQYDGESMKVDPSLTIENRSTTIYFEWIIPSFTSVAGKNVTAGYKNCFIRTNYSSSTTYGGASGANTDYIKIYTSYLDGWNATFAKLLKEEIDQGYLTIKKHPDASPTHVLIEPGSKSLTVKITLVDIGAQIGPGIVVN